jgi:hypothetical protein
MLPVALIQINDGHAKARKIYALANPLADPNDPLTHSTPAHSAQTVPDLRRRDGQ